MAATIATMAMLNTKCISTTNSPKFSKIPTPTKPNSLISIPNLPKDLSTSFTGTTIAGAIFATLSTCEPALAAQQIAQIAEGDNRGIALLLPIVPAIGWVLFNIFQPALNQLERMRSSKGVIIGLGLGGLGAAGLMSMPPQASAALSEIARIGEAAAAAPPTDNRGTLLLIVITPAILWVLYNILQPALNQINKMRN